MKTYIVHVLEIHDNPTFVQAEDEADAIIRIRKGEGMVQLFRNAFVLMKMKLGKSKKRNPAFSNRLTGL